MQAGTESRDTHNPGPQVRSQAIPALSEGFSLVESLMAIFIMAIGLVFVCQMMFVTLGGMSLARSKGTAVLAAQNRLEFLADSYRQNPNGADFTNGSHGPVQVEVTNPSDNTKLNRFNVGWTVSDVSDPRAGKVLHAKQVTVTVTPIGSATTANPKTGLNKVVNVTTIFSLKS